MEIFTYFLKANGALLLFALAYYLLLSRDSRLNARRLFLLSAAIVSTLVHLLPSPLPAIEVIVEPSSTLAPLPGVENLVEPLSSNISTPLVVAFSIWAVGALVMLVRLIMAISTIVKYRIGAQRREAYGVKYFEIDAPTLPFTLFSWIFISRTTVVTKEILMHESAHKNYRHSWDIVLMELLNIMFWYNPVVRYLRGEVRENVEFLADRKVINQDGVDKKSYQFSLVNLYYPNSENIVATYFNKSPIKNRIIMMNKIKNRPIAVLKYSVLPILVLALSFTSARGTHYVEDYSKLALDLEVNYPDTVKISAVDEPLYIIDGVEVTKNVFGSISPDNISNISVLKGKSATDIYGKRARNGAIIATLKEGVASYISPVETGKVAANKIRVVRRDDELARNSSESPLYVIDGKEVSSAKFNALDHEKIDRITVLKNQMAEDLYGKRARNGVIEIKLKKRTQN